MKNDPPNSASFNQQCYDLWAHTYDTQPNSTIAADDLFFPSLWRNIRNKRVLEIGCGTGRHTVRIAALGNTVTAVDLSAAMLAKASARVNSSTVEFIQGDFLTMPGLPCNAYEAVITSLVLEHIRDLHAFFAKAASHLRDQGELFLSEIHPDRIAKGAQANFVDQNSGETVKLASFPHTASEIVEAAVGAGFGATLEKDVLGSEKIARLHPGWEKHLDKPLIKIWCFRKVSTWP
jgi:2-polyprenyl-3-methyl-5-hydroxy-6-metoxy-1,4-benzoquinol methylase